MKYLLRSFILICSALAVGQECTSYVLVNAYNEKEKAEVNLTSFSPADFDARVEKTQLSVVSIKPMEKNRVLILLDVTDRKDSDINRLINGVANAAKQAPEGMPIAFGIFADKPLFTPAFFRDAQQRGFNIDKVMGQADSVGKYRALYDALHEGLALFGEHQPGDTIFLISDGENGKSKRSYLDLEKELATKGTRLLTATRLPQGGPLPLSRIGVEMALGKLGLMTGGGGVPLTTLDSLDWISKGYLLGINMPASMDKPKPWKLKIRDSAKVPPGKPTLTYPQQLAPCGKQLAASN
jgi:hypothetical protein